MPGYPFLPACPPPAYQLLPQWLELPDTEPRRIKQALSAHQVNARGWRLYADHGDALFAPLVPHWINPRQPADARRRALALLRLLAGCEMDVLPPLALLASLPRWQLPAQDLASVPPGLFRAFWKACIACAYNQPRHPGAVAEFVRTLIVPCARWYFSANDRLGASASWRNAGWPTIYRHWQQDLHRDLGIHAGGQHGVLPAAEWPVFVARVHCEGTVFQALHNAAMLRAEGERMSHCVGDYAERCRLSMLRIYAISDARSGQRLGTVSVLEKAPGRWVVDELAGPCNQPLPERVEQAADALLRSLADAYHTLPRVRQSMARHRSRIG